MQGLYLPLQVNFSGLVQLFSFMFFPSLTILNIMRSLKLSRKVKNICKYNEFKQLKIGCASVTLQSTALLQVIIKMRKSTVLSCI